MAAYIVLNTKNSPDSLDSLGGQHMQISDSGLDKLVQEALAGNYLIGPEAVRVILSLQCLQIKRRMCASMIRLNPGVTAYRSMPQRPQRWPY